MGITVHYRGQLEDFDRLEELEDRVIDLTLAVGGQVELWRSASKKNPARMLRGLISNLAPDQDPFCLIFSPEGHVISLFHLEDAEREPFTEPPWCFCKTQFGSVEGHAALVEVILEIKQRFISNLEISDEAEYATHRDPQRLAEAMARNGRLIEAFADGLEASPLSHEAAEDPGIVATRIERIAHLVHRSFKQSETRGYAQLGEPSENHADRGPEFEAEWDELYRRGATRTHKMQRRIEEQLAAGQSAEDAVEFAFNELSDASFKDVEQNDEDWAPGVESSAYSEFDGDASDEQPQSDELQSDTDFTAEAPRERDPLLERATSLFFTVAKQVEALPRESAGAIMLSHAGEMVGGLSQVLPLTPAYDRDACDRGIALVQTKRALRGAAFLRGALFGLPADEEGNALIDEANELQTEIVGILRAVRD